jgi:hypothetical protein
MSSRERLFSVLVAHSAAKLVPLELLQLPAQDRSGLRVAILIWDGEEADLLTLIQAEVSLVQGAGSAITQVGPAQCRLGAVIRNGRALARCT